MANTVQLREDPYCKYTSFKLRPNGYITCLGFGNEPGNALDELREIKGVSFQKVDKGIVRPVIGDDQFCPVIWPNAPSRPPVPPNLQLVPAPAAGDRPALWDEFTNTMRHAKNAILNQMTGTHGIIPRNLLEGFQNNVWREGPENKFDRTGLDQKCLDLRKTLQPAGYWSDSVAVEDFLQTLLGRLNNGKDSVKQLLLELLPACRVFGRKGVVMAPNEISTDASIRDGVTHCLMYGYHDTQLRGRKRVREMEGDEERQLTYKILLRSRSRSLMDDDYNVETDSTTMVPPEHEPDINALLRNPDNYRLKTAAHHRYFQPYKCDILFYETRDVPVPNIVPAEPIQPQVVTQQVTVKVVVNVSSWDNPTQSDLDLHVYAATEHIVSSCLAALAVDQDLIYGLVVVVDGLKLVAIRRQQEPHVTYHVTETGLITWDQSDSVLSLLHTLNQIL